MSDGVILLVENHFIMRNILRKYLAGLPCRVVESANGMDALDKLSRLADVTCVIMDITMPRMDGLQTAARLRSLPHHTETPILFCTAMSPQRISFPDWLNNYGLLNKPFDKQQLLTLLNNILPMKDA